MNTMNPSARDVTRKPDGVLSFSGALWHVARRAPLELFSALEELPPLVVQVLHNRGYAEVERIHEFLNEPILPHDPYLMRDMDKAVSRTSQAVRSGERVCIYGDYDVDGISATAMLVETAILLGIDVCSYIPDRVDEGYGLNTEAVEKIVKDGVALIITADCGTTADEEVARAADAGIDVIVTDHHHADGVPSRATAVLNPNSPASDYPFTGLSGVGVAYKFVQALAEEYPEKLPYPETFLDLVALGTIADVVPLRDENRGFVINGLEVLRQGQRAGLRAIGEVAHRPIGRVTSSDIGFGIAPRLNAAGRIAHAQLAFDLLREESASRAEQIANDLDALNTERRQLTEAAVSVARQEVGDDPVVFSVSEKFVPGVVGLAASKLSEEFGVPAFVGALIDGVVRGSARSPQGFHLAQVLGRHAELLETWGGHARAAGFTVQLANVPKLRAALVEESRVWAGDLFVGAQLHADGRVFPRTISLETFRDLDQLAPWGEGHEQPCLVVENVRVQTARLVGTTHLLLTFREIAADIRAIWFQGGQHQADMNPGARVDVAFRLDLNVYRGETRLQMVVDDVRPRTGERSIKE